MTKDELYNQLLEKVRAKSGYVKFDVRPILITNEVEKINAAAIFESTDDSSPLKIINEHFVVFDVDDYFGENEISWLVCYVSLFAKTN